jgi:myo-inositol-1(or 4)-monophosphatase
MPSGNDLLNIAGQAAQRAGDYLRTAQVPSDPSGWTAKGRADWVTEVDRTAEGLIVEVLRSGAPDSQIIGEELSPELRTDGLVWIVDPLDGTTNFIHRYPCYAVSIGAAINGAMEAAVVLHVPLNRMSTATRGGGAWEEGTRLHVSRIVEPGHALIGTGLPYRDFSRMDEYVGQLDRITRQVTGIRRPGSAAIDLTDVAAGRFDGFWEQRLSAWDIAAGTLLVREAGGLVTDPAGRNLGVEHAAVVAGNPPIHRWLLQVLSPESPHARID